MRNSIPGESGIVGIIAATVGAGIAITLVSGGLLHWVAIGGAIVTGLMAVKAINKK